PGPPGTAGERPLPGHQRRDCRQHRRLLPPRGRFDPLRARGRARHRPDSSRAGRQLEIPERKVEEVSLADIVAVSPELDAWLRETRRLIHVNPELMFEEKATSELVKKHLTEVGVEFKPGVGGDGRSLMMTPEEIEKAGITPGPPTGGAGVLGIIKGTRGQGPGKTVLLRADMDALPLEEENDVEYKSKNPGKMHACGHDLHTTVLMGVAEILERNKHRFDGTVKLMFQPGEEGGAGALAMIEDGILDDPPVDAAFALHVGVEHGPGHVS